MISYPVPRSLSRRHRPWRAVARLCLEALEGRALPSLTPWPGLDNPLVAEEANDTAFDAHDLGLLSPTQRGEAVGRLGDNGSNADVDWFSFSLSNTSRVVLSTLNELAGTSLVSVLSLYNEDTDFLDTHNPVGKRLLAQVDAADNDQQDARITRDLPAGTYRVAVSGSGNRFFHPHLADSGLPGDTGDFGLLITVGDPVSLSGQPIDPADGPAVLTLGPAAATAVSQAPFVVRVTFSKALDPSTLPADPAFDDWVRLYYNPAGTFGDGNDQVVALISINYSTSANELQLNPQAALLPGFYQVFLAGDSLAWPMVLRDFDGLALGSTATTPDGQDVTAGFQIDGAEGVQGDGSVANDTADTAHAFGALADGQFVQARGAIGDDPAYDPTLEDPFLADPTAQVDPPYLFNPAADVDLYSFQVPAGGPYLFTAEVFAGRIGSPLDPALSLYYRQSPTAPLTLVAANDSTLNQTRGEDFSLPLFSDSALFVTLAEGEYFLAVSSSGNMPETGAEGVFDPNVSHSGRTAYSTGTYVLNAGLHLDAAAPRVVAVTPAAGDVLAGPPVNLVVEFDEAMNVYALAAQAYATTQESTVAAVYVQGPDGQRYVSRLNAYDWATNRATFLMLDGLPNGAFELHLSGAEGLTDLAGNSLEGNNPADLTADYVLHFTVDGPERPRDASGQLQLTSQEPNDDAANPQDLGVLFPRELTAGVHVTRSLGTALADGADYYRFELLQSQAYLFVFSAHNLPAGAQPQLFDALGNPVYLAPAAGEVGGSANLEAGVYVLVIDSWDPLDAAGIVYELHIWLLGNSAAGPVGTGALPAARFQLATSRQSEVPPPPVQGEQPPSSGEQPPPENPLPPPVIGQNPPPLPPPLPLPEPLPPPPLVGNLPGTVHTQELPPATEPPLQNPEPNVIGVPARENASLPPGLPGTPSTPDAPVSPPSGLDRGTTGSEQLPPAPALMLLVTIVSPTLRDVTPLPGTSVTTLTITSRPPEGAVLPALLLSLRSGPVGGVQGPAGGDATLTQNPQAGPGTGLQLTGDLLHRTTSSQYTDAGGTTFDAQLVVFHGTNSAAPTAPETNPSVTIQSWQRALDMYFGTPGPHRDGSILMPETLLQQYQHLRSLWNEAFEALFAPSSQGTRAPGQQPNATEDGVEFADELEYEDQDAMPSPEATTNQGMLGQSLAAMAGALVALSPHRQAGRRSRDEEEGD